ncbi:major facilitator superfamily domain-containing protein [Radiomyces spectabilis]|uniref:major facilitator superfamily domain-containing protein n=1 Tax=Radiomyces spectabilis TaxID=64574 RepID=UPI00221EFBF7|nr:major facilitator superfamily domain-containing protein [Radiomyces spectabilis]KAI8384310.1 major facilitator superfamily domain-containing protein [Radiomyces spectabilis]
MTFLPDKIIFCLSFLTALLVANVSGPQYVYPTFGPALTKRFDWSALENSLVSTATFVGVSFSGPLCAWMVEQWGIQKTLRVSGFLAMSGPLLLAQTYAGRLPNHFILCAMYLMVTGVAAAAAYLCALDSQSYNFKAYRGMSMGITSASLGLCGFVYSQIDDVAFKNGPNNESNTYGFLMFFAFAMAAGMLLGSFVLGPIEEASVPDKYAVQRTVSETSHFLSNDAAGEHVADHHHPNDSEVVAPLLPNKDLNFSGMRFFTHPVGFALFTSLFIILGLGYVFLANIGSILLALSLHPRANLQHVLNMHVSLFSVANCCSRAAFGTLSDVLQRRWGIHRLWLFWMAALGLLLNQVYLVTFVSTTRDLVPCTVMFAVVYGIAFGVAPATTAEFGTELFARNWGWLLYAPAFGSQLFNVLYGALYDGEAHREAAHICRGSGCFRDTFLIGIGCSVACLAVISWAISRQNQLKLHPSYQYSSVH